MDRLDGPVLDDGGSMSRLDDINKRLEGGYTRGAVLAWGPVRLEPREAACDDVGWLLAKVDRLTAAATDARSLLADLATDYDLHDSALTHAMVDVVTAELTAALAYEVGYEDGHADATRGSTQ